MRIQQNCFSPYTFLKVSASVPNHQNNLLDNVLDRMLTISLIWTEVKVLSQSYDRYDSWDRKMFLSSCNNPKWHLVVLRYQPLSGILLRWEKEAIYWNIFKLFIWGKQMYPKLSQPTLVTYIIVTLRSPVLGGMNAVISRMTCEYGINIEQKIFKPIL